MEVSKRDGRKEGYVPAKIIRACMKAGCEEDEAAAVERLISIRLTKSPRRISVDDLHDMVEGTLMATAPEAAKSYILYRQKRTNARNLRLSPDGTALASYIDASKYCKWREDLGRRESWDDAVTRNLEMHLRRYPSMSIEIAEAYEEFVYPKIVTPSMRSIQFGGTAIEVNHARMYNCVSEDTQFITSEGVRSFADFEDGDQITVLTHNGSWKPATVRSYGEQLLYKIRFARGRQSEVVRATRDHRWLTSKGWTTSLSEKDRLASAPEPAHEWEYESANPEERLYWAMGYVFGDGTRVKDAEGEYKYSMVRLCGDDGKYLSRFQELGFSVSSPPSCNGDSIAYTGRYLKEPPTHADGVRNVTAFVRGYLDADGHKDPNNRTGSGEFNGIQSSEQDHIDFIRSYFPVAGVYILSERDLTGQETNYGVRPYTVAFKLCMKFGSTGTGMYSVQEIVEDGVERVWCLEVEEDHSFVMPSGIVTGNCSFTLCDRPRFFSELFFLLLSGCGVGYSVQRHHVRRLPPIQKPNRQRIAWFEVPDTVEGWAEAVEALVNSYVRGGPYLDFIYMGLRTEGTPLITSGGRAPGHVPLKIALESVRAILEAAVGRQLRPIECHDICCHLALAVLSGGIRRSSLIALFSPDDVEMRDAKRKPNVCFDPGEERNTHRAMANNSAVFVRGKTDKSLFEEMFTGMKDFGEPGIYFTSHPDHGGNPCGEIGLDPVFREVGRNPRTGVAFCNLTEINAMKISSVEHFYRAARCASMIGTLQAGYSSFPFLGEVTEQLIRRDALLGVGITGIMNNPIVRNPEFQREAAQWVNSENVRVAGIIGINPAARTTTVKPAGTSTLSHGFDAPGHHTAEARRSFRRVTANPLEPCFQKFREVNPHMCEEKADGDWVITFPIEVPSEALVKEDIHGTDFMDAVFSTYSNWVAPGTVDSTHSPGLTHNVSCTVPVKDGDWDAVCEHAWRNRKRIAAMAFSSYDIKNHPHLPRQAVKGDVDEARWNELIRDFKPVDYSDVNGETYVGSACEGLSCEIGA